MSLGSSRRVFKLSGTFFTSSWLGSMEETQWYSPDAFRARLKDSMSDTLSSIYLKGFLKTFCRALGSRRTREMNKFST